MPPFVDLNRLSGFGAGEPGIADINEFLLRQHESRQPNEGAAAPWLQQNMDLGGSLGMQRGYDPALDGLPAWQAPDTRNHNNPMGAVPWIEHQASLSRPLEPGGMRDLGIDPLTSPFAPSGIQDLNQHNRLNGVTGPYGGTDPRFFGGGVNMPNWSQPPQPDSFASRFNAVNEQPFMPLAPDPFSNRFNEVYNQPSYATPGFDDWTRMAGGGDFESPTPTQDLARMLIGGGGGVPFDDPRGDFIGATPSGGPRSSPPQIALMMPFPSVFNQPSAAGRPQPLPNYSPPGPSGWTPGIGLPMNNNPSWTSWGSPSFF